MGNNEILEGHIHRAGRAKEMAKGLAPDVQFKVVDRVLGRKEEILGEKDSLERLYGVIEQELRIAQGEPIGPQDKRREKVRYMVINKFYDRHNTVKVVKCDGERRGKEGCELFENHDMYWDVFETEAEARAFAKKCRGA
jgi:hypothetical protein